MTTLFEVGERISKVIALTTSRVIAALDAEGDNADLSAIEATYRKLMPPKFADFPALVARAQFVREWRSPRTPAQIAALDSAIAEWRAEQAEKNALPAQEV